jgi:hypothetical protein
MVKEELKQFMIEKGIMKKDGTNIRKMTAEEMREFSQNIENGTNLTDSDRAQKIKKFNDGIRQERLNFERNFKQKPVPRDTASVKRRGESYVKNSGRYLASLAVLNFIMTSVNAKDGLDTIAGSPHFKAAISNAQQGNLSKVEEHLGVYSTDPGGNHLIGDLVREGQLDYKVALTIMRALDEYMTGLRERLARLCT